MENPFLNVDADIIELETVLMVDGSEKTKKRYNTERLINFWLSKRQGNLELKTGNLKVELGSGRTEIGFERLMNRIKLDAHEAKIPLMKDLIEPAVQEWLVNQQTLILTRYKKNITFRPGLDSVALVADLLEIWCGPAKDQVRRDLDIAVMCHFIWQVKRKFWNLQSAYHMMPVLVGSQGGGKTRALEKFLKPIFDLYAIIPDMAVFNDERQLRLLTKNYVLFTDEMGRANEVQLGNLKNMIGEGLVVQRLMRSTSHESFQNRATFIGASNEIVSDIVYDATGMRRFWQIDCLVKFDWARVNATDFTKLWQSVDETGESPIIKVWEAVAMVQKDTLRPPDSVEFYLSDCPEGYKKPNLPAEAEWTRATEIYKSYADFSRSMGQKNLGVNKFGRRLRELGFEIKRSDGVFYLVKRGRVMASDVS